MRRHTPLCKAIAQPLGASCAAMDPGLECLDLDRAIRSLGRSWRELDMAVLIDVIENAAANPGEDSVAVFRRLLVERL